MSQQWRVVGDTSSDLTGPEIYPATSRPNNDAFHHWAKLVVILASKCVGKDFLQQPIVIQNSAKEIPDVCTKKQKLLLGVKCLTRRNNLKPSNISKV